MKTQLLTQDNEPFPIGKESLNYLKNEGILTSSYKKTINRNFFNFKSQSVFGTKQRVKSRLYNTNLGVDAILKVSFFALVFIIATI